MVLSKLCKFRGLGADSRGAAGVKNSASREQIDCRLTLILDLLLVGILLQLKIGLLKHLEVPLAPVLAGSRAVFARVRVWLLVGDGVATYLALFVLIYLHGLLFLRGVAVAHLIIKRPNPQQLAWTQHLGLDVLLEQLLDLPPDVHTPSVVTLPHDVSCLPEVCDLLELIRLPEVVRLN